MPSTRFAAHVSAATSNATLPSPRRNAPTSAHPHDSSPRPFGSAGAAFGVAGLRSPSKSGADVAIESCADGAKYSGADVESESCADVASESCADVAIESCADVAELPCADAAASEATAGGRRAGSEEIGGSGGRKSAGIPVAYLQRTEEYPGTSYVGSPAKRRRAFVGGLSCGSVDPMQMRPSPNVEPAAHP